MLAHEQVQIDHGCTDDWRISSHLWAGDMAERYSLGLWEGLYNTAMVAARAGHWWHLEIIGAWCIAKCSSLPSSSPPSHPLPGYLCALAHSVSSVQPLAGLPIQLMGIRKNLIAMCYCDGTSEMGPSPGLSTTFLGQPRPFWLSAVAFCWGTWLWTVVFPAFLCARGAVNLHFNCSHTASSSAIQKLQFRGFCPFLSDKCISLFLFSLFIFYPFPPPIFPLSPHPTLVDIYQNPVWFSDLGHTVHFNLSIWEINLWKNEWKSEVRQLEHRPADRLTVGGGLMRAHHQANGTKADRLHCPLAGCSQ